MRHAGQTPGPFGRAFSALLAWAESREGTAQTTGLLPCPRNPNDGDATFTLPSAAPQGRGSPVQSIHRLKG